MTKRTYKVTLSGKTTSYGFDVATERLPLASTVEVEATGAFTAVAKAVQATGLSVVKSVVRVNRDGSDRKLVAARADS